MAQCIFCRVVKKEIQSRIVFEDDRCLAFEDINPQAPVHVLIIPKKHLDSISQMTATDGDLAAHLLQITNQIAKEKKISDSGYRIVINNGPGAGQTVFHLHLHLLGGRPMHWPPG
jgi:histidine triad (HIT) family protein